jgi:hypothetical protein
MLWHLTKGSRARSQVIKGRGVLCVWWGGSDAIGRRCGDLQMVSWTGSNGVAHSAARGLGHSKTCKIQFEGLPGRVCLHHTCERGGWARVAMERAFDATQECRRCGASACVHDRARDACSRRPWCVCGTVRVHAGGVAYKALVGGQGLGGV